MTVFTKSGHYDLTIPLLGDYQLENASTAVAAIDALISRGTRISSQNIAQGFSQVSWPGRLHILNREQTVVVDGAHNAYSMSKLVAAVKEYFNYKKCFVIFGTSCDKDISGMAREIQILSNHIIITSSSHPRAASVTLVAEKFDALGVKAMEVGNVTEALSKALALANKTDLILITGSLFVVAEAIDYITNARAPMAR